MLKNMADQIYHYHEHDSLLENKVEDQLTEEERKAAWEEFEREKTTGYRQQVRFGDQRKDKKSNLHLVNL